MVKKHEENKRNRFVPRQRLNISNVIWSKRGTVLLHSCNVFLLELKEKMYIRLLLPLYLSFGQEPHITFGFLTLVCCCWHYWWGFYLFIYFIFKSVWKCKNSFKKAASFLHTSTGQAWTNGFSHKMAESYHCMWFIFMRFAAFSLLTNNFERKELICLCIYDKVKCWKY